MSTFWLALSIDVGMELIKFLCLVVCFISSFM
jgi:hypothetical protein